MVYNKSNQKNKDIVYINENIKAFNVLLLDETWEKIWVFSRQEALQKAQDAWLDLVQVWYNWKDKVSICKIMDYGKYQYWLKKKEREKKKKQKIKWVKEIKISYSIDENDLKLKIEKAKELLQKWYSVKFTLRLKWRENIFKKQSKEKMESIESSLKDYSRSWWVKEEGKWLSLVLFAKVK
jgi:translation initiation factor IF-3